MPDDRHAWHVAINQHHYRTDGGWIADADRKPWMYEAKEMAGEVPRLALLFKLARTGGLPKVHRQCSHSALEPIVENHLTCCLGVKCAECPALVALDAMQAEPEAIDTAKAWTCAAHIVSKGGDWAREGYVLTVDDRMFWNRVYENMAAPNPDDDTGADADV